MACRKVDETNTLEEEKKNENEEDSVKKTVGKTGTESTKSFDITCFQGAQVVLTKEEVDIVLRARQRQLGYLDDEIRLVLIGKTGVGKSATGNTIIGETFFKSEIGASSVTRECSKRHSRVCGRDLLVIDTPGIFDTETDPLVLQEEIRKCIQMASPGPHAILFVMKLSERYKREDYEALQIFCSYFGEKLLDHVITVFTHADSIQAKNVTLNEYIEKSPQTLKDLLKLFGNRKIAFNNEFDKYQSTPQVEGLITMVDALKSVGLRNAYYVDRNFEIAEEMIQNKSKEIEYELQIEYKNKTEEFRKQCVKEFDTKLKKVQRDFEEQISELRKTLREESLNVKGLKLKLHPVTVERIPKPFLRTLKH